MLQARVLSYLVDGWPILSIHNPGVLQARVLSYLVPAMAASVILNIPKFLEARHEVGAVVGCRVVGQGWPVNLQEMN